MDALERDDIDLIPEPGAPLPGQERLELVAARAEGATAEGVVAAGPALGRFHELLPHQAGHPGAPAAPETHGTGVRLEGPGALALIEYARDRTARGLADFFEVSATDLPVPPDPAAPRRWAAVLRTVAAGVEQPLMTPTCSTHCPASRSASLWTKW